MNKATVWITASFVCLIGTLTSWMRVEVAVTELLWLDELHTGWVISDGPENLFSRATIGNQTPLFFWLTSIGTGLFGTSEFTLRLISIVSGVAALLLSALVVYRWTRLPSATLLVTFLLGTGADFVYYGTEARPYALMYPLSILHAWVFLRIVKVKQASTGEVDTSRISNAFNWFTLSLLTVGLIYTHLLGALLFAPEILFAIYIWAKRSFRFSRQFVLQGSLFVVACAVACWPLVQAFQLVYSRKSNWGDVSSVESLWNEQWLSIVTGLLIPWVAIGLSYWLNRNGSRVGDSEILASGQRRVFAFSQLWAFAPLVITSAVAVAGIPLALSRYLQVGSVGFAISTAVVLSLIPQKWIRCVYIFVIIAVCGFFNPVLRVAIEYRALPVLRVEDWKTPISLLNDSEELSDAPLFLFGNVLEDAGAIERKQDKSFQDYLMFPVHGFYPLMIPAEQIHCRPTLRREHFAPSDFEWARAQGGAWLLVRASANLRNEIVDQLTQGMGDPASIQVEVLEVEQSPVWLVKVQIVKDANSK